MAANPPSVLSSILTYAWMFVALSVVVLAILWAVETFTGVVIEGSAVGWVPTIVTAMQVGQRYGKLAGTRPSGRYAWAAGLGFTLINIVLSAVALGVTVLAMGWSVPGLDEVMRRAGLSPGDMPVVFAILGGVVLLMWVLLRFAFSFGARQGIRIAERAAKG
jgi:hypothetical protein